LAAQLPKAVEDGQNEDLWRIFHIKNSISHKEESLPFKLGIMIDFSIAGSER
jgi:hypothetical protein